MDLWQRLVGRWGCKGWQLLLQRQLLFVWLWVPAATCWLARTVMAKLCLGLMLAKQCGVMQVFRLNWAAYGVGKAQPAGEGERKDCVSIWLSAAPICSMPLLPRVLFPSSAS